jgi:hypothetical protein
MRYTARIGDHRATRSEMSVPPVYCPSCGTQNVSGLRYCTRCGTNLEAVSKALTGSPAPREDVARDAEVAYAQAMSRKLYKFLSSLAFFGVVFWLFKGSWWTLLILFWVADPLKDLIHLAVLKNTISDPAARLAALDARKSKKGKKKKVESEERIEENAEPRPVGAPQPVASLPSRDEAYGFASPPPSVTEGTTRHLDDREPSAPRYVPPPTA